MILLNGVCRLAAAHPILALLISAVLLLAVLGVVRALRLELERASW